MKNKEIINSRNDKEENNKPVVDFDQELINIKKQLSVAEKNGDEPEVIRLESSIYQTENIKSLSDNQARQLELKKEIEILEKEKKDPSSSEKAIRELEIEQKNIEKRLIALAVKTKSEGLENNLDQQIKEADKIATGIDDPILNNEIDNLEKAQISAVAGAEAAMNLNIKDFSLEDLDKEIKSYRKEINQGETKNTSGKYNEQQVLDNEIKLRRAEEIKSLRVAYEGELKNQEIKYKEYENKLYHKQREIEATEAWDKDKITKLKQEKSDLENEFQKFVKDEVEPLKAGRLFEVGEKKNNTSAETKTTSGSKSETAVGVAPETSKKNEATSEKKNNKKYNKIASQGTEILYKSISSRLGVKFLADIGLTTWAKLGDKLLFSDSKLFKFAKNNDIYRLLSDKKNTKEVMKVLKEKGGESHQLSVKIEAVKTKISSNERLSAEEKDKYLEQLKGILMNASEKTTANQKQTADELQKLTRSYLESKSSSVGIVKDAANTALTLSGAVVLRAAMYGASAMAERLLKASKEYQREYTGSEKKPDKISYMIKDLCITSVKETMKGFALSKTDTKGKQLKGWERGLNLVKSLGTGYLIAGIGGDAFHEISNSSYVFDKSAGLQNLISSAKDPNSSMTETMYKNFTENLNRSTFGLIGSAHEQVSGNSLGNSKIETPGGSKTGVNMENIFKPKSGNSVEIHETKINTPANFEDIISNKGVKGGDSVWRSTSQIFKDHAADLGYKGDVKDIKALDSWAQQQTGNALHNSGNFTEKVFEGNKVVLEHDAKGNYHVNIEKGEGLKPGHLEHINRDSSLPTNKNGNENINTDQEEITPKNQEFSETLPKGPIPHLNKMPVYGLDDSIYGNENNLDEKHINDFPVGVGSSATHVAEVLPNNSGSNSLHENHAGEIPRGGAGTNPLEVGGNGRTFNSIDDLKNLTNGSQVKLGDLTMIKQNSLYNFENKGGEKFGMSFNQFGGVDHNDKFNIFSGNRLMDLNKAIPLKQEIYDNLSDKQSSLAKQLFEEIANDKEAAEFLKEF